MSESAYNIGWEVWISGENDYLCVSAVLVFRHYWIIWPCRRDAERAIFFADVVAMLSEESATGIKNMVPRISARNHCNSNQTLSIVRRQMCPDARISRYVRPSFAIYAK